ncbi:hypothetical protein D3C83_162140 [compost metagenome]
MADLLVQGAEVGTRPEALLELVGRLLGGAQQGALAEDDHPRSHRGGQQNQHDELDHPTGVENQLPNL